MCSLIDIDTALGIAGSFSIKAPLEADIYIEPVYSLDTFNIVTF